MKSLDRIVNGAAIALFASILVLVNVQIVCRFVLSLGVPWTEEVSRLLFIWLAYIGAAIGVREGSLIVIETLPEILGPRGRAVITPIVWLVSIPVIVFLFAASIPLVQSVWPTTLATVDWISHGWSYLAFTVSFALMMVYSFDAFVRARSRRRSSTP